MRLFKYTLVSALLSSVCVSAFAADYLQKPVHHPIRIIPPTLTSVNAPQGLTPQQVKKAYGIDQLQGQGNGQIIAIIAAYDDPNIASDLAVFDTTFNLPVFTKFQKFYATGTKPDGNAGWAGEIALDVEWSHAIAPLATIYLIEAASAMPSDLDQAVRVAVALKANVISMSWGGDEYAGELTRDQVFNNPNITFVASSGDSGHGVSYPAASPYVISVGGTTLMTDFSGTYVSETAWAGTGGGLSQYEHEPASQLNYPIPNNPQQWRGVPDVSYNSGMAIPVYNTYPNPEFGNADGWFAVGGTSAAAPQWSGIIAIANSLSMTIKGRPIPDMKSLIYKISSRRPNLTYHDIITGNNGTCGYYCDTHPGYDYVTGLGTPQALLLVNMMIQGSTLKM